MYLLSGNFLLVTQCVEVRSHLQNAATYERLGDNGVSRDVSHFSLLHLIETSFTRLRYMCRIRQLASHVVSLTSTNSNETPEV